MMTRRVLIIAVLASAFAVSDGVAQQQQRQSQLVRGTIERVDGNTIYGKGADGSVITLKLTDKATITAVLKATVADIKSGDYIGSGAVPQADGSQRAIEVHIFPKPQEDGGHFYEGWYGAPNGTMTNGFVQPATVTTVATDVGDSSIVVKYPQGEKRIIIPADAHIVRNVSGSRDDLKAGAAFRAQTATKQPDGTYTTSAINVGREGARPF
jgi:hypothetical protein